MKIFDRFLVRSFIGPLFLTLFIVLFVLVMQFLWVYIDELVGKGLSFKVILEFLMWGTCTVIPLALPLATLLASIMTLGNLGEFNELLAMKAAGISLHRTIRPLIIASFLISVGAFFVSNNLVPLAYKNIFALRDDISRTKEQIKIPLGIFYNGIDNFSLRVEARNPNTDMMYGIMVYDHTQKRGNVSVTLADSGLIRLTPDKTHLLFTLYSGESFEDAERPSTRDTSYAMQRVHFDEQSLLIALDNYAFERRDQDRFGNDVMALNLHLLTHRRDSLDSLYVRSRAQFISRLLVTGPLDYTRQYDSTYKETPKGAFPLAEVPSYTPSQTYVAALNSSLGKVEQLNVAVDNFIIEDIRGHVPLRRASLEWYRKFTTAIACFLFFFIGAPLGAIMRKGGLGTPAIVSMLFFVVYWVVDISGKKLATDGNMTAASGALISTLVLLPIGVFLTWKAAKDASVFNKDLYIKIWDRTKKGIAKCRSRLK